MLKQFYIANKMEIRSTSVTGECDVSGHSIAMCAKAFFKEEAENNIACIAKCVLSNVF